MNTNATYTYGQLSTKQLKCDSAYQRPIDPKRVKAIAEHFNPLKVNPIKVSHRNNAYWIFDGQHTARVLMLRNGNMDLMVECKIYEGLTQRDEAELFARQNEYEKRVEKNNEMKALYAAGDVEVTELKNALESIGFIFDFSKHNATNRIVCCGQVFRIFRKTRRPDFAWFLEIIKNAWHGEPESLRTEIIGGMWILCTTYKGKIDSDAAVRKFSCVSPIEIIRDGKLYKNLHGDMKYAYVLANIYNKRLNGKNRLDLTELTNGNAPT